MDDTNSVTPQTQNIGSSPVSSSSKLSSNLSKLKDFWRNSNFAKFLPVAIIGVALPLTVFVAMQVQNIRQHAQLSVEQASLRDLTNYVISGGSNDPLKITTSALGSDSIAQEARNLVVVDKSRVRKELMKKLAIENPQEFLLNALPSRVTDSFPSIIKDNMEKQVKFSGKLVVIHYDNFKDKQDKYVYQVQELDKDNKVVKTYTLHFAKAIPSALTDSKVNIEGYALDNELVVQGGGGGGGDNSGFYVSSGSRSNPIGNQKILVIMFNFSNDISEPMSRDDLDKVFKTDQNSVSNFINETSFNKASISVDYAGYYQVPYDNFDCSNSYNWSIAAEGIAYSKGIDVNSYFRHIYVFPTKANCWASAWATIGGNPSMSWMPDKLPTSIYEHEFGHNLGLAHSNLLDCYPDSIKDFDGGFPIGCTSIEYGDVTDVMGNGAWENSFQYNGPHKDELGWLDSSKILPFNSDAQVTIGNTETDSSTLPTMIEIPVPASDEFYYVSFRKATGMDAKIQSVINQGADIHLWKRENQVFDNSEQTKLIDNNPSQRGHPLSNESLFDGQTFTDSYNGITIKQITHTNDSATLEIKIDKSICRRQIPDVSINPLSQVGNPGQELTYTINLKNNDTSQCDGSTFNFSTQGVGPYQGQWGNSFSPSTVVLTPGQSTSIAEKIHSSGDSPIGVYTIQTSVTSNNIRQTVNLKSSYIVFGQLSLININPGKIEVALGSAPIGMSALAYDNNNQPIRTGVTYEWSMSSTNSVGTLDPANDVINRFTPLKPGFGEITVKGTLNGDSIIKTVPVHVSGVITPTPTNVPTPTVTPFNTPTQTLTPTPGIKTITLYPTADSYVTSSVPNANYGISNKLSIDASPQAITYMMFDLRQLAKNNKILKASLRLRVPDILGADSRGTLKVWITSSSWKEGAIKFSNRPALSTKGPVGTLPKPARGQTYYVNLTDWLGGFPPGDFISIGINTGSADEAMIKSRELTGNSNKPALIIQYQ